MPMLKVICHRRSSSNSNTTTAKIVPIINNIITKPVENDVICLTD